MIYQGAEEVIYKLKDYEQDIIDLDNEIKESITTVQNNLNSFSNTVNGSFKDGLIQTSEAKAIKQSINIVQSDKAQLDKDYSVVYGNASLTGTPKTNLASSKTDYDSKYNSLITTINNAIADGKSTETEANAVNASFTNYKSSIGTLKQRIQEALDAIGSKKVDDVEIGGRNLFQFTDYKTLAGVANRGTYHTVSIDTQNKYNGNSSLKVVCNTISSSGVNDVWQKCWDSFIVGRNLVLSLYIKGSVNAKMWCRIAGAGSTNGGTSAIHNITTSWTRLDIDLGKVTTEGVKGSTELIYGFNTVGTYYVNSMMLEYGTKSSSDWTPAPEDIDKEFQEVKTTMSGVSLKVDAAEKAISDEVWKSSYIEVTDENGNIIKKRLDDLIVQSVVSLDGINQSVKNFVTDLVTNKIIESSETILKQVPGLFETSVNDYFSGDASDIIQRADEIEHIVGKNMFDPISVRYIRDWVYSNDKDTQNRFTECKVINSSGTNLAKGKLPKTYDDKGVEISGVTNLAYYTDEVVNANYIYTANLSMLQLDLGKIYDDIERIQVYHYFTDGRSNKTKLEISSDGVDWITVYDSDIDSKYIELESGYIHDVQTKTISDQLTFIKQTMKNINLTAQENANNFASIQLDVGEIRETVSGTNGLESQVSSVVEEVKNSTDGWKVSMKKIGAYDGTDVAQIETQLKLNEQGVFVESSDKQGQKVKITGSEFSGIYNEGLSDSEDITVFSLNKDTVITDRLVTKNGADFGTVKIVPVNYGGHGGIAFVKGGGNY